MHSFCDPDLDRMCECIHVGKKFLDDQQTYRSHGIRIRCFLELFPNGSQSKSHLLDLLELWKNHEEFLFLGSEKAGLKSC